LDNRYINNLIKGLQYRVRGIAHNPYSALNIGSVQLAILKHSPAGKLRHINLFGEKVSFTNPREFLFGLKEIFVDKIYQQKLPANPLVIDCGSNIGLSVIYFKKLYPHAEIIAFEPDDENFALLQKNVQAFQFSKVMLHKAAVWITNEPLQFSVTGTMGSSIVPHTHAGNTVTVKAFRLKELLTKPIDFLKMDIEGAEYEVLKDIAPDLHWVQNLFVEYHGTFSQNKELIEILSIIETNGFQFYIKEAASVYDHPFTMKKISPNNFDVQLNIFCTRRPK